MENQFQKYVNLSYLAVAILLGYVVFSAGARISGTYDLEAHYRNIDVTLRILSVAAGGILFAFLYKHQQSNTFMNEVMVELSRVTWPTQKETSSGTFIVIVMVLISGVLLWFFDNLWTIILKGIL